MSSAEDLNRMGSIASLGLTQASSFPIKDLNGVGLDIANNDGATDLIFKLTYKGEREGLSGEFKVPAGGSFNSLFKPFKQIAIVQTTLSFDMVVKEPLE